MGLIPDVDLTPVERAAKTIAPVLDRLSAALEEHNAIEREKLHEQGNIRAPKGRKP
jgi:hypothetical protein